MLFTGLHVPYTEIGHQSTFLTRLPDIVRDVPVITSCSSASWLFAYFVFFSVQVENIDLRKLKGLELHLKMDQLYSPIY